jgi:sterol desaturase/sphingolipid hydroxylase (fatty acid hydroxylase superfamily)
MTHHLLLYPPEDYLSDTYRSAGKDDSFRTFLLMAIPLIVLPIILLLLKIITVAMMIVAMVMMGIMGFLHSYLHDAFHIRNHFLERLRWFKSWQQLHYLHHIDQQRNFGIFFFAWDRLFNTTARRR